MEKTLEKIKSDFEKRNKISYFDQTDLTELIFNDNSMKSFRQNNPKAIALLKGVYF